MEEVLLIGSIMLLAVLICLVSAYAKHCGRTGSLRIENVDTPPAPQPQSKRFLDTNKLPDTDLARRARVQADRERAAAEARAAQDRRLGELKAIQDDPACRSVAP